MSIKDIKRIMTKTYWKRRRGSICLDGLWEDEGFTAYDYEDGDAKNVVNEIARYLRTSEQR